MVPSGADALNYTFNYVNGIFIVDARTEQTITWTQDLSSVAFGNNIDLNASASSNLAVTFDIADESIAKLLVTRDINLQAWWRLDGNSTSEALKLPVTMVVLISSPSMDQPERSENLARVYPLMEPMTMHPHLDTKVSRVATSVLILSG